MLAGDRARRVRVYRAVRDRGISGVDDQRHVIGSLERRLIKRGKCAARVRGLELRNSVVPASSLGKIKAPQLVIQNTGVMDRLGRLAGRKLVRDGKFCLFTVPDEFPAGKAT